MAGRWGALGKKKTLELLKKQYDIANEFIATTRVGGYRLDLNLPDINTIKSFKQARDLGLEIASINPNRFKLDNNGRIKEIDVKTDLLNITRITSYRTKTGKILYYDNATFSAKEFSELLKQQQFTNKNRERLGLSTFSDIKFKKGTSYIEAMHSIAKSGNNEGLVNRIQGDVTGVITSLENAILKSDNLYRGIDKIYAQKLIDKIYELGTIDSYNRIRMAMDELGQNKFYDIYGSNQYMLRDTGLMDTMIKMFGIIITKDDLKKYLDEDEYEEYKNDNDNEIYTYQDILRLQLGGNIKW